MTDETAQAVIGRLRLQPHPEGGFFRETHREPDPAGGRDLATAILFLLPHGARSHWHRVDAAELWLFHSGAPLRLRIDGHDTENQEIVLGTDILAGELPQATVPAGAWQSAEANRGWTLVSCVVTPGFSFDGFELAPSGWSPAVALR